MTDAETLKRFESIMQSGPQLVLQLYIMTEFASNPSQEPQESNLLFQIFQIFQILNDGARAID